MPKPPIPKEVRTLVLDTYDGLQRRPRQKEQATVSGMDVHNELGGKEASPLSLRSVQKIIKEYKQERDDEEADEEDIQPFESGWPEDPDDVAYFLYVDALGQVGDRAERAFVGELNGRGKKPSVTDNSGTPLGTKREEIMYESFSGSPINEPLLGYWTRREIRWAKRLKYAVGWPNEIGGYWLGKEDYKKETLPRLMHGLVYFTLTPIHSLHLLIWLIKEFANRERYNQRLAVVPISFKDLNHILALRPWKSPDRMSAFLDEIKGGRRFPLISTLVSPVSAVKTLHSYEIAFGIETALSLYRGLIPQCESWQHWEPYPRNPESHQARLTRKTTKAQEELLRLPHQIKSLYDRLEDIQPYPELEGPFADLSIIEGSWEEETEDNLMEDSGPDFEVTRFVSLILEVDDFLANVVPAVEKALDEDRCVFGVQVIKDFLQPLGIV